MKGVSTEITEEQIQRNIKGIRVIKVKRLPYTRNGVREQSMSVMLIFDEYKIPERVRIGYVRYMVRPYIPHLQGVLNARDMDMLRQLVRAKFVVQSVEESMSMGNAKKGQK